MKAVWTAVLEARFVFAPLAAAEKRRGQSSGPGQLGDEGSRRLAAMAREAASWVFQLVHQGQQLIHQATIRRCSARGGRG
jgi:hypothetical protein